jgi:uncharacterized membrane protein YagU involved in acid resistance
MSENRNIPAGILAGVAGGLIASWVMNEFITGPGKRLKQAVQSDERNQQDHAEEQRSAEAPQEDATMKAADAIVNTATGGRHLSWEGKQKGGPVVHYAFGSLMGGIYGGLAEISPAVTAGFGTTFGSVLFGGADLVAVPALHLAPPQSSKLSPALVTPFSAHLVYGATTEIIRRLMRVII